MTQPKVSRPDSERATPVAKAERGNRDMSESKSTPGPWGLSESSNFNVVRPSEIQNERCSIASVHSGSMGRFVSYDEAEANARLIAAAPQLLEAAKLVRDWYENSGTEDPDRTHVDALKLWEKCRDAVKLAEGGK